jgi:pyruvate formate lyase activating enzyme
MSRAALTTIQPYLDAANVDLKSFRDAFYRTICKGRLQPVLESIACMKELGIWVEVTTLVIPGENDSADELRDIARFIAGVSVDIPWHISRFHPDYHLTRHQPTPPECLRKAYDCGKEAGLRYVYLGNVGHGSDTYCPFCQELLIKRAYFDVVVNNIKAGSCSFCRKPIAGVFSRQQ